MTALPYPENIRIPVSLFASQQGLEVTPQSQGAVPAGLVSQNAAEASARKWSGLNAQTPVYGSALVSVGHMGGPYTTAHLFWAVSVQPEQPQGAIGAEKSRNYGVVFVDAETGAAYTFIEGFDSSLPAVTDSPAASSPN